MNFGEMLFGKKEKMQQFPTLDPQQIGFLGKLLGMSQQGLEDPYAGFQPIEQRARSQFQQSIPSLAERFTALSPNAQRSSGFQSALGRAQGGLEESLAAMRSQYGMQNRGQMMQMGQMGLTPHFENIFRPKTFGLMGELAGPALKGMMGMGTGMAAQHGAFGRDMMNQSKGGEGLGSLLPLLMMMA